MIAFLMTAWAAVSFSAVDPMLSIKGDWATQGYGAVVRMAPCMGRPEALCGTLLWVWDSHDIDVARIGRLMLEDFQYEEGRWRGGRLTNPEDGRVFRGSIRQRDADTLELKGCAARVLCAQQTWRRLESLPHMKGLDNQS